MLNMQSAAADPEEGRPPGDPGPFAPH